MLASALVPVRYSEVSAIRSVRYWEVCIYGKRSWYIAHCPLYGRCPLFGVSAKRGSTVPLSVLRFLSSWYETQKMSVRWSHSFSDPFSVSNGVRQGSVLFPVLFSVYLDELLEMLGNSGVGCHWGGSFVGALCYADDIVLLAPCASALRHMLNIATSHGLVFNAQLICFRRCHTLSNIPTISFNDITLPFLKEVTNLGHILR